MALVTVFGGFHVLVLRYARRQCVGGGQAQRLARNRWPPAKPLIGKCLVDANIQQTLRDSRTKKVLFYLCRQR
jgi:hypothetical protein